MESSVVNFYNNKTVFITGGTGFVGICLIQKLLRSCNVKNIYLLIRPKKGKEITERLEQLTKNSVFDKLREENKTDLFNKLIAVVGDIGEENLGISPEDRTTLINTVQVVFHSAATLDFEADLKTTTIINLLGTRRVVQLCKEMKQLKAFVHVSSAYVNCKLRNVDEIVYPAPANANVIVKLSIESDFATLKARSSEILDGHANSYTFTKHLAEHEVINGELPAAIVRPSMITGAMKEPVPGWTVSKNGPQAFLMGASKGVVRRLPIVTNIIYDYIPIDIVVNSLIVAAYNVDHDSDKGLKVYHCTTSTCNPFYWKNVEKELNVHLRRYPLLSAVWYPYIKFLPSILLFKISAIFFHFIPAYILDTITRLCGGRPILVRMHTNINKSLDLLEKFIFSEWKFNNPRLQQLHESLAPRDQLLFPLDVKLINWDTYILDMIRGTRQYLSKESPKTLSKAIFKNKILMVAHLSLQGILLGLVWWLVKVSFSATWTQTALIVPIIYLLFNLL